MLLPFYPQISKSDTAESQFIEELKRFDARIAQLKVDYRKEFASRIRNATRIELYLVKFDSIIKASLAGTINEDTINIFPSSMIVSTLEMKNIDNPSDKKELLSLLASQIETPKHSGGAFGHVPLHAVRVYDEKGLIFETTFSWSCRNFGFPYPRGTEWLDTSNEIEKAINRLLPVPPDELERYKKTHERP